MIAVYPAKRQGLPARCCIDCQTTKGKMLELQVGDAENKTVFALCEACAADYARQIMRGGVRRPKRGRTKK